MEGIQKDDWVGPICPGKSQGGTVTRARDLIPQLFFSHTNCRRPQLLLPQCGKIAPLVYV